ncbi:g11892 [Coccomyxa elongata]
MMSTIRDKDEKHDHPVHRTLEGVVESGLHASLKEVLDTLSEDETIKIISKVVHAEALEGSRAAITESLEALCSQRCMEMVARLAAAQALTVAETSTDPLCRKASRLAAKDIVLGSYDAVEQKQAELMSRPYIKYVALPAGVVLAACFFIPLCLCMWRFGLYGMECFQ